MTAQLLLAVTGLSVPPVSTTSKEGAEILGEAMSQRPLAPDKLGFMDWQWVVPVKGGVASGRIERARAKFVGFKDGTVTIKTGRGQTVEIPRQQLSIRHRNWPDEELHKQEEAKEKKSVAKP